MAMASRELSSEAHPFTLPDALAISTSGGVPVVVTQHGTTWQPNWEADGVKLVQAAPCIPLGIAVDQVTAVDAWPTSTLTVAAVLRWAAGQQTPELLVSSRDAPPGSQCRLQYRVPLACTLREVQLAAQGHQLLCVPSSTEAAAAVYGLYVPSEHALYGGSAAQSGTAGERVAASTQAALARVGGQSDITEHAAVVPGLSEKPMAWVPQACTLGMVLRAPLQSSITRAVSATPEHFIITGSMSTGTVKGQWLSSPISTQISRSGNKVHQASVLSPKDCHSCTETHTWRALVSYPAWRKICSQLSLPDLQLDSNRQVVLHGISAETFEQAAQACSATAELTASASHVPSSAVMRSLLAEPCVSMLTWKFKPKLLHTTPPIATLAVADILVRCSEPGSLELSRADMHVNTRVIYSAYNGKPGLGLPGTARAACRSTVRVGCVSNSSGEPASAPHAGAETSLHKTSQQLEWMQWADCQLEVSEAVLAGCNPHHLPLLGVRTAAQLAISSQYIWCYFQVVAHELIAAVALPRRACRVTVRENKQLQIEAPAGLCAMYAGSSDLHAGTLYHWHDQPGQLTLHVHAQSSVDLQYMQHVLSSATSSAPADGSAGHPTTAGTLADVSPALSYLYHAMNPGHATSTGRSDVALPALPCTHAAISEHGPSAALWSPSSQALLVYHASSWNHTLLPAAPAFAAWHPARSMLAVNLQGNELRFFTASLLPLPARLLASRVSTSAAAAGFARLSQCSAPTLQLKSLFGMAGTPCATAWVTVSEQAGLGRAEVVEMQPASASTLQPGEVLVVEQGAVREYDKGLAKHAQHKRPQSQVVALADEMDSSFTRHVVKRWREVHVQRGELATHALIVAHAHGPVHVCVLHSFDEMSDSEQDAVAAAALQTAAATPRPAKVLEGLPPAHAAAAVKHVVDALAREEPATSCLALQKLLWDERLAPARPGLLQGAWALACAMLHTCAEHDQRTSLAAACVLALAKSVSGAPAGPMLAATMFHSLTMACQGQQARAALGNAARAWVLHLPQCEDFEAVVSLLCAAGLLTPDAESPVGSQREHGAPSLLGMSHAAHNPEQQDVRDQYPSIAVSANAWLAAAQEIEAAQTSL